MVELLDTPVRNPAGRLYCRRCGWGWESRAAAPRQCPLCASKIWRTGTLLHVYRCGWRLCNAEFESQSTHPKFCCALHRNKARWETTQSIRGWESGLVRTGRKKYARNVAVTKEQFLEVEKLRVKGVNIYSPYLRELMPLTEEQHMDMLQNYRQLVKEYLPERWEQMSKERSTNL